MKQMTNSETERTVVESQGLVGSCCLMGTELQFCKMRRVLGIGCKTVRMSLTLLTTHFEMVMVVNFILHDMHNLNIQETNLTMKFMGCLGGSVG